MAKSKQETIKPRFTVKCPMCGNKWECETFTTCSKCDYAFLDADDHKNITSRRYHNGIEIARTF